ncbi:MAG: class I SAM-dependent methyltransferase [Candidatus Heimdallarchaeota archaeon]
MLKQYLKGRKVIEVACGTGYWTQFLSETAKEITAIDINNEVLVLARQKNYLCPISFQIMDAYQLAFDNESFNAGLANFWFSHIPKTKIDDFISELHRILKPRSRVFITDNHHLHLSDSLGELITREDDANTYKLRQLEDGSQYIVLKNYYSEDELFRIFSKHGKRFSKSNISFGEFFWRVTYELD